MFKKFIRSIAPWAMPPLEPDAAPSLVPEAPPAPPTLEESLLERMSSFASRHSGCPGVPRADDADGLMKCREWAYKRIQVDPIGAVDAARDAQVLRLRAMVGRDPYRDWESLVRYGVECGRIDERLGPEGGLFDYSVLSPVMAFVGERDLGLGAHGLLDLEARYLLRDPEMNLIECPQSMLMRVAMGLSVNDPSPTERALERYQVYSERRFGHSTPTLFNSGTNYPQLSSCNVGMVPDSIDGIFDKLSEAARLSKWAGGLGYDFSRIRAKGSPISTTGGVSQGLVSWLKLYDLSVGTVNQGGRRKGTMVASIQPWHLDVMEFIDLRSTNSETESAARLHNMNVALWVPDAIYERARRGEKMTLFCPSCVEDIVDACGPDFTEKYEAHERAARSGDPRYFRTVQDAHVPLFREIEAEDLFAAAISAQASGGHPWITFKDPSNVRYTNQHAGTVHSSNLCTEVIGRSAPDVTVVCTLGSVNLAEHVDPDQPHGVDREKLRHTVRVGVRALDDVLDINFTAAEAARKFIREDRSIGIGQMGHAEALAKLGIPFDSDEAVAYSGYVTECVSQFAIEASCELAQERGTYPTYEGSQWDRGILPQDSMALLEAIRPAGLKRPGGVAAPYSQDNGERLDWSRVREDVATHGVRNSNLLAIAPTASQAGLLDVYPCVEPIVKFWWDHKDGVGDKSRFFRPLVEELVRRGLWDDDTWERLGGATRGNGESDSGELPDDLAALYRTARSFDQEWIVKHAAARAPFVDQAQSTNLFFRGADIAVRSRAFGAAYDYGLKTTYYLRGEAESVGESNAGPAVTVSDLIGAGDASACSLDDPECLACQ